MLKTYKVMYLYKGLKESTRINARDIYSIKKWLNLKGYEVTELKEIKYMNTPYMVSVWGEQYELFTDYEKMLEHIEYVKTKKQGKDYFYNSCYYDINNKETYLRNTVIWND